MANISTPVIQIKDSNVGIGTTSPTRKLQITDGEVYVRFNPTTVAGSYILGAADGKFYVIPEATFVPTMTFNSGNVLIGTTTDNGYRLNVNGITNITGGTITAGSETTYAFRVLQGKPLTLGGDDNYAYIQSWSSGPLIINGQGNNVLFSNGSTNVGIGTAAPQKRLEVITPASDYASVGVRTLAIGEWTGIHFGYREDNTLYRKSAIVFNRTGGAAQGDIYFLNNNAADNSSATLANSRMVIKDNGNVLIGLTTDFGYLLSVNGTSYFQGTALFNSTVTASSLIKSGGTSSQYLMADGSVSTTSNVAPRYVATINVSQTTYTTICTINGGSLASAVNMSFQGTSGNVVVNVTAQILVNHFQDIVITTTSGFYSQLNIRIISNNNESYSVEAQVQSGVGATTDLNIEVFPLNSESVTFGGSPLTPGTTLVHSTRSGVYVSATEPMSISSGSDIYAAGKIGIGTTNPTTRIDARDNPTSTNGVIQATPTYSGGSYFTAFRAVPSDTGDQGNYTGLFMGSISSDNALITSGSVYNSAGQYLPGGTTSTGIGMGGGAFTVFGNTGLTAGTQFAPTPRMQVIGSTGNVLIGTTTDAGYRVNLSGDINVSGAVRLAGGGATVTFISESWGINLNGSATQPTQVRGSSFSVGYSLGAGTDYGTGNMFVSGNVGIGTTSPSKKLHVYTSDNEGIFLQGTGGGVWMDVQTTGSELWSYGCDTAGAGIYNRTDNAYRFYVANSGNVLIGTTTDNGYKLRVNGSTIVEGVFTQNGGNYRIGLTLPYPGNNYGNGVIYLRVASSASSIIGSLKIRISSTWNWTPAWGYVEATVGFFWTGSAFHAESGTNIISATGYAAYTLNIGQPVQENGYISIPIYSSNSNPIFTLVEATPDIDPSFITYSGWSTTSHPGTADVFIQTELGVGTRSPSARLHVSGGDGIINNAFIGEVPTYTSANAQFSHTSRAGVGEYSFLSASDGETFVNSKSGYNIRFRVNNADQVIINSSGNVGIGTTTPDSYLSGTKGLSVYASANPAVGFANPSGYWLWYMSSSQLRMWNSSVNEVLVAHSTGNVTIGSNLTDAGYKLDVYGEILGRDDIRILNTYALVLNGTDNNWRIGRNTITDSGWLTLNTLQIVVFGGESGQGFQVVNSNGTALFEIDGVAGASRFTNALGVGVNPSGTAGRIDASNDIVAYSSSDRRLKENIKPIENALDKVKSLTGVEFDWKAEYKDAHGYEGHDTGVIAQEVQEVMPTAVRTNDTGYLAVRYEKLIGLLIEANKELANRVEYLEAKLK